MLEFVLVSTNAAPCQHLNQRPCIYYAPWSLLCVAADMFTVSVLLPLTPHFLPVRRSLEFYDACLYEAVMACDSDCVLGGGELIVRIPRDMLTKITQAT